MANKVTNRNGVGRLQNGILETLAKHPDSIDPASVILAHLTESPTAAQRISVSKSLRLCQRGLVDRWEPKFLRPGNENLYALNSVGDGGRYRHPFRGRRTGPPARRCEWSANETPFGRLTAYARAVERGEILVGSLFRALGAATNAKIAEIRLRSQLGLQPLQPGTQPLVTHRLQTRPRRRSGRVARLLRGSGTASEACSALVHRGPKVSGRQRWLAQGQVRGTLADHQRQSIGIGSGHVRDDRGIGDAQTLDPVHAEL